MSIFTDDEKALINFGLMMRKNHIETGNIFLSATDVRRMGKYSSASIKALGPDQIELIEKMDKLAKKVEKL